jgi:hypothetical protein
MKTEHFSQFCLTFSGKDYTLPSRFSFWLSTMPLASDGEWRNENYFLALVVSVLRSMFRVGVAQVYSALAIDPLN